MNRRPLIFLALALFAGVFLSLWYVSSNQVKTLKATLLEMTAMAAQYKGLVLMLQNPFLVGVYANEKEADHVVARLRDEELQGFVRKTPDEKYAAYARIDYKYAVVGKDSWLFDTYSLDAYKTPFSGQELARLVAEIRRRAEIVERAGGRYLLFFGPAKSEVYPENLPEALIDAPKSSRLDQLMEALGREKVPVEVIDPRQALVANKDAGVLYDRLGTHWNELGQYFGYRAVIDRFRRLGLGIEPLGLDAFAVERVAGGDKNLLLNTPLHDLAVSETTLLKPVASGFGALVEPGERWREKYGNLWGMNRFCNEAALPAKILLFGDSFTGSLPMLLSHDFRDVIFVSQDKGFNMVFDPEIIEAEKPDYVAELIVNTRLFHQSWIRSAPDAAQGN